jgi:uncharacterized 2Fe-2S/4Fe-4S cluster protein (DUF4445 family)
MPVLNITGLTKKVSISYQPGISLRDILDLTEFRVRSACRGTGSCGLCRVFIENGSVNEPTQQEFIYLSKELIDKGVRLACQVFPSQDICIQIENPAPKSNWRSINFSDLYHSPVEPFQYSHQKKSFSPFFGLAIDLGTTHINLTLWDLVKNKRLTGRTGLNLQYIFGADVMTRVMAATQSSEQAEEISKLAFDSIGQGIFDICSREGYDSFKIQSISVVGNTPEITLLTRHNYDLLLQPEYWTSQFDYGQLDTLKCCDLFHISKNADIHICNPLAGFVGSDLLAGVLSTHMTDCSKPRLLIDFGTNTEIALWDGSNLWVTSAAGGPAFEGCGMTSGMSAVPGAIYQINNGSDPLNFECQIISYKEPEGICGSGFVDLIAHLLKADIINEKGKFQDENMQKGFAFLKDFQHILIHPKDIDLFQRAKAAIGTGIQCLLASSGLELKQLEKIYICGVFGRYLNIANAQQLGLLPDLQENKFQLCGNTALAGCELLLVYPEMTQKLQCIRDKAHIISMANYEAFESLFLENLFLCPMEA